MTVVPQGYFLAEYYLETSSGGLRKAAEKIASEETTGSWVGGGEPTQLYEKARGQVHRLEEIEPDRKGIATIAFPTVNLPLDPYLVPSLWLFLTGGPLFERLFCDRVRMLDFHLPAEILRQLPGPKFGVAGCRKFLGLSPDELMVATIIKPCAGLTAEEVAGKCYDAALGGIDFIKDDEKMNNPDYCPLEKKVKLVAEALRRAYEQTGRKVIYCPHISSRADHMVDMARRAVDNGATGLMINCFATGFPALQMLAERDDLPVPIYVHSGGRTAWARFEGYGIDVKVTARMVRLLGGDFFRAHMINGYLIADTQKASEELVALLREPLGRIRDTVPALSGGLNARNLVDNLKTYGLDILPMAGGAVIDHPMGTQAGVIALRQAAESYRAGVSLEKYAADHEELRLALQKA